MCKKRTRQWLAASGSLLLLITLGYLLVGGRDSGAAHADAGVTTEQAAALAGAKILPTDPKLKIEPKLLSLKGAS